MGLAMGGSDLRSARRLAAAQTVCDRGNAIIAKIGRTDIHWFVHHGKAELGWRNPPGKQFDDDALPTSDDWAL